MPTLHIQFSPDLDAIALPFTWDDEIAQGTPQIQGTAQIDQGTPSETVGTGLHTRAVAEAIADGINERRKKGRPPKDPEALHRLGERGYRLHLQALRNKKRGQYVGRFRFRDAQLPDSWTPFTAEDDESIVLLGEEAARLANEVIEGTVLFEEWLAARLQRMDELRAQYHERSAATIRSKED